MQISHLINSYTAKVMNFRILCAMWKFCQQENTLTDKSQSPHATMLSCSALSFAHHPHVVDGWHFIQILRACLTEIVRNTQTLT